MSRLFNFLVFNQRFIMREGREAREIYSMISDGGLEDYCVYLKISPEDLKNKKILDIGAGKGGWFAQEATKECGAKVVSISPALKMKEEREYFLLESSGHPELKKSMAARAQELPFQKNSFDVITACFSVPHYLDNDEDKLFAVKEMIRVVKPGGKIYIGPFPTSGLELGGQRERRKFFKTWFGEKTLDWLRGQGIEPKIMHQSSVWLIKPRKNKNLE